MTQEEKISLLEKIRLDYAFLGTPSFDVLTNAIDALKGPWVKTADRLPTEADAGSIGLVMVRTGNSIGFNNHYDVLRHPEYFAYWMPIPPLPEVEK